LPAFDLALNRNFLFPVADLPHPDIHHGDTPSARAAERSEAIAGGPPIFSSAENVPLLSGWGGAKPDKQINLYALP